MQSERHIPPLVDTNFPSASPPLQNQSAEPPQDTPLSSRSSTPIHQAETMVSNPKLVKSLALYAPHNYDPLTKSSLIKAQKLPSFKIEEIPQQMNMGSQALNAKQIVAQRLTQSVNQMESQGIALEDVYLITDFNLGFSGQDIVTVESLKALINTLQTQSGRQFIVVSTTAQELMVKKAGSIAVKVFLKGSGGVRSLEVLNALTSSDPHIIKHFMNWDVACPQYSFNNLMAVKLSVLFSKMGQRSGIPMTPMTPSTPATQAVVGEMVNGNSTPSVNPLRSPLLPPLCPSPLHWGKAVPSSSSTMQVTQELQEEVEANQAIRAYHREADTRSEPCTPFSSPVTPVRRLTMFTPAVGLEIKLDAIQKSQQLAIEGREIISLAHNFNL